MHSYTVWLICRKLPSLDCARTGLLRDISSFNYPNSNLFVFVYQTVISKATNKKSLKNCRRSRIQQDCDQS